MSSTRLKQTAVFSGKQIQNMQGNRGWLTCLLDTGERVTISFSQLFALLDKYDIQTEKYGNRWRVTGFIPVQAVLPQTGLPAKLPVDEKRLDAFLEYMENRELQHSGLSRLSGGFAKAELDSYDDEYIYIVLKSGVQNDAENREDSRQFSISIVDLNLALTNQELYNLLS